MRKILLISLVLSFIMFSNGFSLTASDIFVSLDANHADLTSGYAEFTLYNPLSFNITANLSKFNFYTRYNNTPTTSMKIFIQKNVSTAQPVYISQLVNQTCLSNVTNETIDCSYYTTIQNGTTTVYSLAWVPLGSETFYPYKYYKFRVEAKWQVPKPDSDGRVSVYRDWVPFANISGIKYEQTNWAWWNASFSYRTPLILNNTNNANDLFNYMVSVNISYNAHMDANFTDLRFTWINSSNPSSEVELNYWVQSKVNSNYAKIWLKIPTINGSKNGTLYMYYGNVSPVSSVSTSTILNGTCNSTNIFNKSGSAGTDSNYAGYYASRLIDEAVATWASAETAVVHWANVTIPSSRLCEVDVHLNNQYQTTTTYELRVRYGTPTQEQFFNNTNPISAGDSSWAGNNTHWIFADGITDVMVWRAPTWSTGARPNLFSLAEIFGYERIYSLPEPNLLLGVEETEITNTTTISLNYPNNNTLNTTTRNIAFNYTATFYGGNIANCSLYHNYSGTWGWAKANESRVVNGTSQIISFDFADDKNSITWSIGCWDQTMQNFTSNRTLNLTLTRNTTAINIIFPTSVTQNSENKIRANITDLNSSLSVTFGTMSINLTKADGTSIKENMTYDSAEGLWLSNSHVFDIQGVWTLYLDYYGENLFGNSSNSTTTTITVTLGTGPGGPGYIPPVNITDNQTKTIDIYIEGIDWASIDSWLNDRTYDLPHAYIMIAVLGVMSYVFRKRLVISIVMILLAVYMFMKYGGL